MMVNEKETYLHNSSRIHPHIIFDCDELQIDQIVEVTENNVSTNSCSTTTQQDDKPLGTTEKGSCKCVIIRHDIPYKMTPPRDPLLKWVNAWMPNVMIASSIAVTECQGEQYHEDDIQGWQKKENVGECQRIGKYVDKNIDDEAHTAHGHQELADHDSQHDLEKTLEKYSPGT